MGTYVNAVHNMEFSGPTIFTPLLKQAFASAQGLQNSFSYMILLILTDGTIHDMAETKDIIVKNANLPISVVIVGLGKANFDDMKELDGDGGLFSQGTKCPRDIVQFVPFNKFGGNAQLLTQELLREIPNQVNQYFVIFSNNDRKWLEGCRSLKNQWRWKKFDQIIRNKYLSNLFFC